MFFEQKERKKYFVSLGLLSFLNFFSINSVLPAMKFNRLIQEELKKLCNFYKLLYAQT